MNDVISACPKVVSSYVRAVTVSMTTTRNCDARCGSLPLRPLLASRASMVCVAVAVSNAVVMFNRVRSCWEVA